MMFLALTAITILTELVYSQSPSPCPSVLTYDTSSSESDRWYGVISIKSKEDLTGVYINIVLDRPAQLLGNWFGDATSNDNVEYNIVNQRYKLEAGPPVSVRFFVKYNPAQTIPSIKSIRLNGRTVCSARNEEVPRTTTEKLHISHTQATTRRTSARETENTRPSRRTEVSTTESSFHQDTRRTTRKSIVKSTESYSPSFQDRPTNLGNANGIASSEDNSDDSFYESEILNIFRPQKRPSVNSRPTESSGNLQGYSCGKVASSASPLISHGQDTKPGQWPWHCALYYSRGIQLIYSCGGTLITEQHVITAAHCVTKPHTSTTVNLHNVRVYFGKHNLINFGNEVQERGLQEMYVHPEYNHSTYFNDIAVLKLSKPVEITNYVRTACLWNEDSEVNSIIGKAGTVVGWGFDQNRQLSNKLMQAQMPVVSTVTCIYSNRDFFSQFTFENNFCAGFRNGTSVCNGDSGGGMVFPRSGTSGQNTVWQLRGVVSVGVALQGEGLCDPMQYIVFTDVAKYIHWIRQVIAL